MKILQSRAWQAILMSLVMGAVALGPCMPGGTAGGRPPDTSSGLAAAVASAPDFTTRKQDLMYLLQAVRIGVYNDRGRALQRGAERTAQDFYLYDFEVRELAFSLGRNDRRTLSDLAAWLTSLGVRPGGADVKPNDLNLLLSAGVRTAIRSPHGRGAFVALLIHELGLQHHPAQDLARATPVDKVALDPVQFLLFAAALTVPAIRAGQPAAGISYRLLASGPCADIEPGPAEEPSAEDRILEWEEDKTADAAAELVNESLAKAFQVLELLNVIVDGLHGMVVAFGLKLREKSDNYFTHYGPSGHGPHAGDSILFQVVATMQDDLGEDIINCLGQVGLKIPKKGPVPGLKVAFDGVKRIRRHGTLNPAEGILFAESVTGDDGVATLKFTPKSEVLVGQGIKVADSGLISGFALWGDYVDNKLGRVDQYIAPIFASMKWTVERHRADLIVDTVVPGPGGLHLTGYKCDGPIGDWDLKVDGTVGATSWDGRMQISIGDNLAGTTHATAQMTGVGISLSGRSDADGAVNFILDPSPHLRASLTTGGSGTIYNLPIIGAESFGGAGGANFDIPVTVGVLNQCSNS